ncbi:MAG: pyroglutamyl-peptidase I [Mesotoga sp.]|nr:pyroglutamyl-peptidase I [Mesotoga sp.]
MVILSHFDPFGGDGINASKIVAQKVAGMRSDLRVVELPTVFDDAFIPLMTEIERTAPEAINMLGQAAGRTAVTPEKVAINWKESTKADNNGYIARGERISISGADAYFSTLPLVEIIDSLQRDGLPLSLSFTAGTFVCNYLFYRTMEYLVSTGKDFPVGFVHIPCIPQQTVGKNGLASMDAALSAAILSRMIDVIVGDGR